ncbi:MAG: M6 family metalloprotease domain-containing protein [Prevotella sp.]
MQYPDKQFLNPEPQAYWHNALNTGYIDAPKAIGSLHQYFIDQSNGIFDVDFDVRGPFTAKENMEYYGKDVYLSKYGEDFDQHPDELVIEGCEALMGTVDFADYDWDGDGEIEQIIVIYAGNGQNDSQATDRDVTIWPHTCEITDFKSSKPTVQDGITINTYCIINDEFRGKTDGFGVIAHEYGHCLGFPDFYSTGTNHGKDNFGKYDVMHSAYFEDQVWVPAGYTAYEKEFLGWTTIEELTQPISVSALNSLANGGKAYMIRNDAKSKSADEYYLIENRRKEGWDTYIPGEGLLVTHYDYNATIWNNNVVNTVSSHQRAVIISANSNSTSSYPYPYVTIGNDGEEMIVNDYLTDDSKPAASVFNENVNGTYLMGKPLTNIRRDAEGLISFDFMGGTSDISDITNLGDPIDLEYFDLQGRKVSSPSRGIYIIRNKKTSKTYKSSFN